MDESKKKPSAPLRRGGLGRGLGALIPSGPLPGGSAGKGHFWNALDNPPAVDEESVKSVLDSSREDDLHEPAPVRTAETADQASDPPGSSQTDRRGLDEVTLRGSAVDIHVDAPNGDPSALGLGAPATGGAPVLADTDEAAPTYTSTPADAIPPAPEEQVSRETAASGGRDPDGETQSQPARPAVLAADHEDLPAPSSQSGAIAPAPQTAEPQAPDPAYPLSGEGSQDPEPASITSATDASDSDTTSDLSSDALLHRGPSSVSPAAVLIEISPDAIRPNPKNPRQVFDDDELAELSESIKEFGLLQPIVVREHSDGYELVMGERRLRASKLAGIESIPVIVRQTDDDEMLRDALLENIHRVQLHPLEEAAAYQQLIDEFGVTHEELAHRIKRSRPAISNTIRLLKLPSRVQNRVAAGVISGSHARALLSLDDAEAQEALATRIVAEGLSVRATEEAVSLYSGDGSQNKRTVRRKRPTAPALGALAERLSDHFDTRALVQLGRSKGKIVVEFASIDDLERIVAMMAPPLATQRVSEGGATDPTEEGRSADATELGDAPSSGQA